MSPEMQSDNSQQIIFVYGTLMRGESRHHVLTQQEFIGEASTKHRYRLYHLGTYPGLVDATSGGFAIQGELYAVTSICLEELDEIEAVAEGLYERKRIQLQPPWADMNAESYFYLGDVSSCTNLGSQWSVGFE